MENFDQIELDLLNKLKNINDRSSLDLFKTEVFGKKGSITELFKKIVSLDQNKKKDYAAKLNELKQKLEKTIKTRFIEFDQVEINKIHKVLINVFHEDPISVEVELQKCLNEIGDNKSLYSFTSKINKSFENEKKILLLEILWEIILEDGYVHDFESNLIRRLAGLLYISDVQCGNAKITALKKIKTNN